MSSFATTKPSPKFEINFQEVMTKEVKAVFDAKTGTYFYMTTITLTACGNTCSATWNCTSLENFVAVFAILHAELCGGL